MEEGDMQAQVEYELEEKFDSAAKSPHRQAMQRKRHSICPFFGLLFPFFLGKASSIKELEKYYDFIIFSYSECFPIQNQTIPSSISIPMALYFLPIRTDQ